MQPSQRSLVSTKPYFPLGKHMGNCRRRQKTVAFEKSPFAGNDVEWMQSAKDVVVAEEHVVIEEMGQLKSLCGN